MFASTAIVVTSLSILASAATDCATFAQGLQLQSYKARVLNATDHAANTYTTAGISNSIPFCEINTAISYGDNDTLIFASWLPSNTSNYASRFLAIGNGGMAGTIDRTTMIQQLNTPAGFAIHASDAGHRAADNNNGTGAPNTYLPYLHDRDQLNAWIHDGVSIFTPVGKAITKAYFSNQAPKYSYYAGCSTGGAQGFALAQFHPELFDGIYAGSPGNWYSHLVLSFLWNAQHTNTTATMLTQDELSFTTNAVLDKCDTLDGVKDRLIENPLACKFDIDSLACPKSYGSSTSSAPSASPSCLPATKIAALKSIYAGPKRRDNGREIYPGFSFGSEIQLALQEGSLANSFAIPILQNLVYKNLAYDSNTFNFASDVDTVNKNASPYLDEISPNLSAFVKRGGKMFSTQGWADPYNAALWPIQHLGQLQGNVSDYYRLFMIPGGGHCGAATYYPHVPAKYDVLTPILTWVEGGVPPESVLSFAPPDGSNTTRKLCAWPKTAHLIAGKDQNAATSYVCQ